ncbi:MAG: hypothetical protein WBV40_10760 [Candidatus Cybelea sp.]|jgi:hypothetical protein
MPANFSTAGRTARELIPVPAVPLETIRERSRAAARREGVRKAILCAALVVAAVGAAAGLGSKIYDGIRVWLSGGKAAIEIRSLVTVSDPTRTELWRAVTDATFPVVLPVGLPADSRVIRIAFAPAEHPASLFIQYKNGRTGLSAGFLLTDSSVVNTPGLLLPSGAARPRFGQVYQWRTAAQTIIVPQESGISSRDINRIEAAMATASPATSLAENETLVRRIIVLGGFFEVADVAERIAPSHGESVLVDRGHLRQVPGLVKNHQPMLDSRTVYLTNIPSVRGKPDFSRATLRWPKAVVISANGVRAIASVLQSSRLPAECNCEILFHQVRRNVYQIWKIPIAGGAPVRKYTVD